MSMEDVKYVPWSSKEVPDAPKVSQLLKEEEFGITAHAIPPTSISTPFICKANSCIALAKGTIEIDIDGNSFILNPGDRLYIMNDINFEYKVLSQIGAYFFLGMK